MGCMTQRGPRTCPKKGSRAGKGSGVQVLRGAAEGTGFVEEVQNVCKEKFLLKKSSEALEQVALEGGEVTVSRCIQGMWRCSTEGHRLVSMVRMD